MKDVRSRALGTIVWVTLTCVLVVPCGPSYAQQTTVTDPNTGTTAAGASPSNRSIFLALFANNFIPGVGQALADWVKNALNGPKDSTAKTQTTPVETAAASTAATATTTTAASTTTTTTTTTAASTAADPSAAPPAAQSSALSASAAAAQPNVQESKGRSAPVPGGDTAIFAGVAYQVTVLGPNGARILVDPAQRTFATGERFEIGYRPNFPGLVEVFNIDATGREERIDRAQLGAVQLATLGPYEFVNNKGNETLRIVLRPCVGMQAEGQNAPSRGIAKVQLRPEVANALKACDDPAASVQTASRGIAKVSTEEGTTYALDPVSRNELDSGQLLPREVVIRFVHR